MKLTVATNWKEDLVERLSPYPIKELYGSMQKTPVGGGRPSMILPDVSSKTSETHVRQVLDQGWDFNYLMNGLCFGKNAKDKGFRRELAEHLKWVRGMGVTVVTVANPYMLEFVKHHFPEFTVKMSILHDLDSVNKVKQFKALGADEVALSIMSNRNFAFLKAVRKAVEGEMTLLVNQACLYQCPYRFYHGTVNAHASQVSDLENDFALNFCLIDCSREKLLAPENLVKSRWIRPEDLKEYEAIGFTTFKIAGRECSSDWLVNAARAYSTRTYQGNLADILDGITIPVGGNGPGSGKIPYIDNQKLDGFIEYFKKIECDIYCTNCTYCHKVAEKAVNLYKEHNVRFIQTLTMINDTVT